MAAATENLLIMAKTLTKIPSITAITPATSDAISAAAEAVKNGQLVAFGTETVYGLGGDATNPDAVARIFAAKGRPSFNPLISHIDSTCHAFDLGDASLMAQQLADDFWPGPMTLILNKRIGCPVADLATAGLDTIALRVPMKDQARDFLRQAGCPIAAPSANRSGRISPTKAEHVYEELSGCADLAMILDTGMSDHGLESTVIDARGDAPVILRPGAITATMIGCSTGVMPVAAGKGIISPGQLASHYAPSKPVRLNAERPFAGDVMIGFGPIDGHPDLNLSPAGDLTEAAANLYDMLRRADALDGTGIAIAPIPQDGLGLAIQDRLNRAAADRLNN